MNTELTVYDNQVLNEQLRQQPHVLYRPRLFADGTKWCALLGDNIMEGVCGFGDTPIKAMLAFDEAWYTAKTPAAAFAAMQETKP